MLTKYIFADADPQLQLSSERYVLALKSGRLTKDLGKAFPPLVVAGDDLSLDKPCPLPAFFS